MDCGMVCCHKNRHYIVTIFMAANYSVTIFMAANQNIVTIFMAANQTVTNQHSLNVQNSAALNKYRPYIVAAFVVVDRMHVLNHN